VRRRLDLCAQPDERLVAGRHAPRIGQN
jgi:hypothetical protein